MLDRLGLVVGCFDFIVTPGGEHVFLEVNEMGQLLGPSLAMHPVIDAFAELLVQGRVDYEWPNPASTVTFDDVHDAMHAAQKAAEASHAPAHSGFSDE